jgi:hypothetical protein
MRRRGGSTRDACAPDETQERARVAGTRSSSWQGDPRRYRPVVRLGAGYHPLNPHGNSVLVIEEVFPAPREPCFRFLVADVTVAVLYWEDAPFPGDEALDSWLDLVPGLGAGTPHGAQRIHPRIRGCCDRLRCDTSRT